MTKYLILSIAAPLLLVVFSTQLLSDSIYHWVDSNGKHHFSDRQSSSDHSDEYQLKPLPSIKTVPSKPINLAFTSHSSKRDRKKDIFAEKKSQCEKLTKKIVKLKNQLKTQLGAARNDRLSHDLTELRWEKMKAC